MDRLASVHGVLPVAAASFRAPVRPAPLPLHTGGMIKARSLHVASHRPRAPKAPWQLARMVLLMLRILHFAAVTLAPGRTRSDLLRFVCTRLPHLEVIFRRLLLSIRLIDQPPSRAPFARPAGAAAARPPVKSRARSFSLSLKGIIPDDVFADRGLPTAQRAHANPLPQRLRSQPTDLLGSRLKNLQSVLEDCWRFSAKLQRRLARFGLRLRAPAPRRPSAEIWTVLSHLAEPARSASAPDVADTS